MAISKVFFEKLLWKVFMKYDFNPIDGGLLFFMAAHGFDDTSRSYTLPKENPKNI